MWQKPVPFSSAAMVEGHLLRPLRYFHSCKVGVDDLVLKFCVATFHLGVAWQTSGSSSSTLMHMRAFFFGNDLTAFPATSF
jgi:hypothetical protein